LKIVEGLRFLREADRDRVVFGANGHEYKLRPCVDEVKVEKFERRYSLRLIEKPLPLVKPHRVDSDLGLPSNLSDSQRFHRCDCL
jgi:hypothetical protein